MEDPISTSSGSNFLLVVGHALYSPWKEILTQGQLETWAQPGSSRVIHAYAIPVNKLLRIIDVRYWELKWSKRWGKIVTLIEYVLSPMLNRNIPNSHVSLLMPGVNSLVVEMRDFNFLMNKKMLALLKYGSLEKCDYVVFTTSSSYINIDALRRELTDMPRKNVVAGRIVNRNEGRFPSGSFRVFSKDVLIKIFENLNGYKYWLPEDFALGLVLNQMEVEYVDLKSLDLDTVESINALEPIELCTVSHFRLKSEINGRRIDAELMKLLHLRILRQASHG